MSNPYPDNIDELQEMYDCEWLEDRGNFTRVTTSPENSAWYCQTCGSTKCDAYEGICYDCDDGLD
jgi:hypothetical protein